MSPSSKVIVIGAGIGGLTTAVLLAQAGCDVTVLEASTYPGGCAGTFYHKGYRFDAGATVAGGFQSNGPHRLLGDRLGIAWPVKPADPAWVVHLPDRQIELTQDARDVLATFPHSAPFWATQRAVADVAWAMAAQGLPWPPTDRAEVIRLLRTGLSNFPRDLLLLRLAFSSAHDWIRRWGLAEDAAFVRFLDAQLLISAQTTSCHANALYSATALDLPRQGVFHVQGGIGTLAQILVDKLTAMGGRVLYRREVMRIAVENGRVTGVYARSGRHGRKSEFLPADAVIANLTPGSLDALLGEDSPPGLHREAQRRHKGWGAFILHLGVDDATLPANMADHHQFVTTLDGPLGEGHSIFLSLSPAWDSSRAPEGHRAVTLTTHTAVDPWWQARRTDAEAYEARKAAYMEQMLAAVESFLPGFRRNIVLTLPGTPVTYADYTGRHRGMVGGFPQTSMLRARGPQTGIPNLWMVGDSIFPGQSTAGVTLGGMRVAQAFLRRLPHSVTVNINPISKVEAAG